MNLLDALTTLVDSARQQPETRHLKQAIRRAEARIEQLRYLRNQRLENLRRVASDPQSARLSDVRKACKDICLFEDAAARARLKLARLQSP